MLISEIDEAELKASTTLLYKDGGIDNVLSCILTMQRVQIIMITKLNEILDEENKK